MKTLETIQRLLQLKTRCSLSEIASISGQKRADVLRELTDNKRLLKLDKNGNVVGLVNVKSKQLENGLKAGIYYRTTKVDYDLEVVVWFDPRAKDLETKFYTGMMRESHTGILYNEENKEKLKSMGILNVNEVNDRNLHKIDHYWDHVNLQIILLDSKNK